MKPRKILVIAHSCTEEVNRTVYRVLAEKYGIPLCLVVPPENDVGERVVKCHPLDKEPFESQLLNAQGFWLRLRRFRGLRQVIDRVQPTHILVESDPSALVIAEILWRCRSTDTRVWTVTNENLERNPLAETFRALVRLNPKDFLKNGITFLLWAVTHRYIDRVFTVSADGTKAMEKLGFKGRITQIPLGFDSRRFFPQTVSDIAQTRRELGLTLPTIAYFGRISPAKGITCLVNALAKIKSLRWQFLIDTFAPHSEDYLREVKAAIDKAGIADRVVTFHATHSDMPRYVNVADIVVLPSIPMPNWIEQYGRTVPESLACGKVVVVSNSGTPKELVADSGLVFPQGDANALSERLSSLLTMPPEEVAKLREKAVKRAASLSADRQAEIWWNLLVQDWDSLEPRSTSELALLKTGSGS